MDYSINSEWLTKNSYALSDWNGNYLYRRSLYDTETKYACRFLRTRCIAMGDLHFNLSLRWHHNGYDSVSNHQPHDCLLNRLFRRRSKKTKLRVTGFCAGNSPGTGEFPAQMASNVENVSISWRHHVQLPDTCKSGDFFDHSAWRC